MRRHKFLFMGLGLLIVLVIAGLIISFALRNKPEKPVDYAEMGDATLPVLTMTCGERQINRLVGYTYEMDPHYMRDTIYVLMDTYELELRGQTFGMEIKDVRCKLFDITENRLIQESPVKAFEANETGIVIGVLLDNSMEMGKEYVLDVILEEAGGREIHYYTRVLRDVTNSVYDQIDKVLEFNSNIYAEDGKDYLRPFMESDGLIDGNRNLSHASLVSSLSHITWGDMRVEKISEPMVNIVDVDGEIGFFKLDYMVKFVTVSDVTEYYQVSEYYRMRTTAGKYYVLNYERTADQIFVPSTDTISTTMAQIGIMNAYSIEMMSDQDGKLNCFVANGSLWCMDTPNKTITRIFSFMNDPLDERENYGHHDIKIISVSTEGDIVFLVYGYMNKGIHEGMTGIGLYTYKAADKAVYEDMFVPSDIPFEILDQSIGSLCYLNGNNILYIMMDEYVYKLNIGANTSELIVSGLNGSNSKISATGRMLAWHENGLINTAESVNVLDMETGERYTVKADSGMYIKALGFLNQDFVYGLGEKGNTYTTADGAEYLLMPEMIVTDSSGKILQRNASDHGYFVDSIVEYNRIILNRVVKAEDTFYDTDDFTLFATDLEDYPEPQIYISYEETKKSIYYVRFVNRTTTAGELKVGSNIPLYFSTSELTNVSDILAVDNRYYVYAKGELQGILKNPAEAINLAYENGGSVLTGKGGYFYRRSTRPSIIDVSEEGMRQAIAAYKANELLNVTGITLTEALYFTGNKIPVVWEFDGDVYVIQGYDVADNIYLVDIETGEYLILTQNYMERIFTDAGRCFVLQ